MFFFSRNFFTIVFIFLKKKTFEFLTKLYSSTIYMTCIDFRQRLEVRILHLPMLIVDIPTFSHTFKMLYILIYGKKKSYMLELIRMGGMIQILLVERLYLNQLSYIQVSFLVRACFGSDFGITKINFDVSKICDVWTMMRN